MTLLGHLANSIYLLSYLVKDVLWLRMLSICASSCLITAAITPEEIQWYNIAWNGLFAAINTVQVIRLLRERRPVQFSPEERTVYDMAFRSMKPRDFIKLWSLSIWREVEPESTVIRAGVVPDGLMIVYSGEVKVMAKGKAVAQLKPGQFAGEMNFLTGQLPAADCVASEPTKLRLWPMADLRGFLNRDSDLRATMHGVLGSDLVGKLRKEPS